MSRTLVLLRSVPTHGKLALYAVEPGRRWAIARISSSARGGGLTLESDTTFESLEDAEHAVFLARLRELREVAA